MSWEANAVELRLERFSLFKIVPTSYHPSAAKQLRPGFLSPSAGLKFADIPNGLAAVSKVPVAGWAQIAAYFGFVEFSGGFDDYKTGTPGDYGFKVLTSSDPEEKTKKLSAELANGRLAMMAIIGMFFQVCKGIGMCCGWIDVWIEDVFKHFSSVIAESGCRLELPYRNFTPKNCRSNAAVPDWTSIPSDSPWLL